MVSKLKAGAVIMRRRRWVNLRPGFSDPRRGRFTTYDPQLSGSSGEPGQGSRQIWPQGNQQGPGGWCGPASVSSLVGLRPTLPLVSPSLFPGNPPPTRWVDGAHCARRRLLLDVIAGYDPKDPVTAYSV